ncbi:unnamed protein product [Arabidopsis halleri]
MVGWKNHCKNMVVSWKILSASFEVQVNGGRILFVLIFIS